MSFVCAICSYYYLVFVCCGCGSIITGKNEKSVVCCWNVLCGWFLQFSFAPEDEAHFREVHNLFCALFFQKNSRNPSLAFFCFANFFFTFRENTIFNLWNCSKILSRFIITLLSHSTGLSILRMKFTSLPLWTSHLSPNSCDGTYNQLYWLWNINFISLLVCRYYQGIAQFLAECKELKGPQQTPPARLNLWPIIEEVWAQSSSLLTTFFFCFSFKFFSDSCGNKMFSQH